MRLLVTFCLLSVAALGACEGSPDHNLGFPAGDSQDLGAVRITERSLTTVNVENTGQEPVTLHALTLESGWDGVLTINADDTRCVPGLTLAVGERCVVVVAFEPANDITYGDWLHVDYRPEEGTPYAMRATLGVRGIGVLDCSVRPEYLSAYEEGVAEADARIATDIREATEAGAALTHDDGYAAGYASTYDGAYDQAYDGAYDDGHVDGYDDGYGDGASPAACREGELDGYADGADSGLLDGEEDGLEDGDDIGYDDGYADGLYSGEVDACGYAEKVDPDPSLPGKCVLQGHADTYSVRHYNEAYAAAVAANTAYLGGVSLGETEGANEGQAAGDTEGYADGYRDGADSGLIDGDADQYEACYLGAVDDGYDDGYEDAYETFFNAAYEDAYADGFDDGYEDGFRICG